MGTEKPLRLLNPPRVITSGQQRAFVIGFLSGGTLVVIVWAASGWFHSEHTPAEAAFYDHCLAAQAGNTVACDAAMRIYKRKTNRPA